MIRAYTAHDVDEDLEVWYEASVVAHSFLGETDDRVRGLLSLIGNEVGAVFVHPDDQRSGIGRAPMDHARASRPFLELDVFEANAIGRHFYDAYGFKVAGRHEFEPTGHIELRLRLD